MHNLAEDRREFALKRAYELKQSIHDYLEKEPFIETGFRMVKRNEANKEKILKYLGAGEEDWNNWIWQMKHRICQPEVLKEFLPLDEKRYAELVELSKHFRWAISPYYLSLIDFEHYENSPIYKQAVPVIEELLDRNGSDDPMGESYTNPAPRITRRYPDRLIINVTNQCAMYCRHCQRRRNFGEKDEHATKKQIKEALNYIRKNREIRDVLITGGDALLLSDVMLEWILSELDSIPHVEIKRIGTRVPVTLPQRITPELCSILEKHPPIYINTQFNSPLEVTPEAKKACDMLIKAGVVLGNQAVLLRGINDDEHVMKKLNQELLKIRVRPYYIFHAKQVRGTSHFITKVETGIKIMEKLRGYTSGLAVPTYIINAPGGYGKTPMLPEYLISWGEEEITIRTWENRVMKYSNKIYDLE
ncbi:glutamate 2,3-aminomutase [Thermosyntropha lipolytica DSM 11003]|uniref:Glutamate 2,3-aminomutase n=1 Tax=Thermosyntropha lipolytica DSM 11003 TaxID=1123382 RepID=A0A1M5KTY7_9FIRM|nr:glutamate 2,3-aminomutase [Thermosyntropha lipolytica]SHG56228.1 glutamate 2,3-aminomutase [Thermosyntropha lipolytica DSM 11003]